MKTLKKILVTCFYLAFTLAVCTAGFLLPSILNDYQDRQIFAKIEHTAMEPPELTYSSSLFDTLHLLSQEHYFVNYPSTGSKRTSEEACAKSLEFIESLDAYGFQLSEPIAAANCSATLQLAIVSVDSPYPNIIQDVSSAVDTEDAKKQAADTASDITTAVVWKCSIYYESGYWINLWLDDKSGKAVACSMFTDQIYALIHYGSKQQLDSFASTAANFLEDYYELPATLLEQSVIHSTYPLFDKGGNVMEASYIIQLKEEDGNLIQIPLQLSQDCMILNN
ncbi:MAG: hypothetical protein K2N87_19645 [Eubacterium sp.]|nr:hypothetical protein [Eubacterium sp.]